MAGMGEGMSAWTAKQIGPEPAASPPAVKAAELQQLDGASQQQLREWGTAPEVEGNPPAWVGDESSWERAKEIVQEKWEQYDEPWAVVAHVYFNMGGTMA